MSAIPLTSQIRRPTHSSSCVVPGASPTSVTRSIGAIIAKLAGQPGVVPLLGPQRPAEIINYHNLGSTPALLGGALAGGAAVALGLTLIASVRRRRRDPRFAEGARVHQSPNLQRPSPGSPRSPSLSALSSGYPWALRSGATCGTCSSTRLTPYRPRRSRSRQLSSSPSGHSLSPISLPPSQGASAARGPTALLLRTE